MKIESAPARRPGRNDPCWCGSGKKYKKCHLASDRQTGQAATAPPAKPPLLKTQEQIEGIRRACKLTRHILTALEERIVPGTTTGEIDQWVAQMIEEGGARAATLGYKGYPKSCCTSINEVVCHGIPGDRVLHEGDIINVDVTSVLDGYYGDASRMYCVGRVSEDDRVAGLGRLVPAGAHLDFADSARLLKFRFVDRGGGVVLVHQTPFSNLKITLGVGP